MADAHASEHAHSADDFHAHPHPSVNYFIIFMALCVCTAVSVALDLVKLPGPLLVFGVLAVAVAKALFVMTFFMHLKFEGAWKFIILAPTAILAVGLMVALAPDMAMHYYYNDAPQVGWNQHGDTEQHDASKGDQPATDAHANPGHGH